jgi:FKBP-type peptidyl-prolyl cis-trans isomerase SlpA
VQSCRARNFEGMELSEGLLVIFNDAANTELPVWSKRSMTTR